MQVIWHLFLGYTEKRCLLNTGTLLKKDIMKKKNIRGGNFFAKFALDLFEKVTASQNVVYTSYTLMRKVIEHTLMPLGLQTLF